MNFLNEALYGDSVDIHTHAKDGYYLHALFRDHRQTELCRMKTLWKK